MGIVAFDTSDHFRRIASNDNDYQLLACKIKRVGTGKVYILGGTSDRFNVTLSSGTNATLDVKLEYGTPGGAPGPFSSTATYADGDWLSIVMYLTPTALKVWVNGTTAEIDESFSDSGLPWWSPWAINSSEDATGTDQGTFQVDGYWFESTNTALTAVTYSTYFNGSDDWVAKTSTIGGNTSYFDEFGDAAAWNGYTSGFPRMVGSVTDVVEGVDLDVVPGEIILTGEVLDLSLSDNVNLDIVPGELALNGEVVELTIGGPVSLDIVPGEIVLNGEVLSLDIGGQVQLDIVPGEIALDGETVSLAITQNQNLAIVPGEMVLTGETISLVITGSLETTRRTVFIPKDVREIHMPVDIRQISLVA